VKRVEDRLRQRQRQRLWLGLWLGLGLGVKEGEGSLEGIDTQEPSPPAAHTQAPLWPAHRLSHSWQTQIAAPCSSRTTRAACLQIQLRPSPRLRLNPQPRPGCTSMPLHLPPRHVRGSPCGAPVWHAR